MKPAPLSRDEVSAVRRAVNLERHKSIPEKMVVQISAIPGVLAVRQEQHKSRLWVTYDVRHLNYLQLCLSIHDAEGVLASGFWRRWQRNWYSFQDQNLRDNFNHQPTCCSRAPTGSSSISRGKKHEKH